jgi:hypothetical protein
MSATKEGGRAGRTPTPAQAAAIQIWSRALGDSAEATQVGRAADGVFASLRIGLGRWIGVDGYRALLTRTRAEIRTNHPVLAELSCLGDEEAATGAALQAHGAGAVAAGMIALLTTMIDLLGRIMGEEMALHLVEQSGHPLARNAARVPLMEEDNG